MKGFKKLRTGNDELDRIQDNIEDVLTPILNSEIIDSQVLKDITLNTGSANIIDHKLGRELVGWTIVGKNTTSDIWDEQTSNKQKEKTLILQTDATVTVNILVF